MITQVIVINQIDNELQVSVAPPIAHSEEVLLSSPDTMIQANLRSTESEQNFCVSCLCPLGHPYRSSFLNNLASAVLTCYEQSGEMEDLEEAITYHHEAITLRPPGHPNRSASLNHLANVILTRYEQLGSLKDLEEMITYHHEALDLHPPGDPNRSASLNNLANAVLACYEQSGFKF